MILHPFHAHRCPLPWLFNCRLVRTKIVTEEYRACSPMTISIPSKMRRVSCSSVVTLPGMVAHHYLYPNLSSILDGMWTIPQAHPSLSTPTSRRGNA